MCEKIYLNTNTKYCVGKCILIQIHYFVFWKYTKYIWNWPSSEVTLLRPVYTKNDNYKNNYISIFYVHTAVVSSVILNAQAL